MVRRRTVWLLLTIWLVTPAPAQDPNACDLPGEHPDLLLGGLDAVLNMGTVGDRTAFSFASTSCNLGTCEVEWQATTDRHPVYGQNLFRLDNGRFEQIGMSWLTHRFFALSQTACNASCEPTNGTTLGVGCSSPNSASVNGTQAYLGPRSEVNPTSGTFAFPFTGQGVTGNAIYKRLQIHHDDLDPLLHPGATYFVEGITIAPDDAAAGAGHNNTSYRQVAVSGGGGLFDLTLVGSTVSGKPAVQAWAAADPEVVVQTVEVPGGGRLVIASKASAIGGGAWHYEYAIENLDSHRGVGRVSVPVPAGAGPGGIGFHDVDYHSGEPIGGTDWTVEIDAQSVTWGTQTFAENEWANALRWGTSYNFRFDAGAPPVPGTIALGLFRPGTPESVDAGALIPRPCDGDGECETGEDACGCPQDCGAAPPVESDCTDGRDGDCDGNADCADEDCCGGPDCPAANIDGDSALSCVDCDDTNATAWATPGEVGPVLLQGDGSNTRIDWSAPAEPGSTSLTYEVLRSGDPSDFVSGAICVDDADPADHSITDGTIPGSGGLAGYLVRAVNACPLGNGSLGSGNPSGERAGTICP